MNDRPAPCQGLPALCLLAMLALSAMHAQGLRAQVSFEAYTDSRQVPLNDYFQVSFTLKNADGEDFRAPDFKNFTTVGPPGRSASTTILNGKMSKELAYNFTLQPKKKGRFTIGPASIVVNGKRYTTDPLTIEVVDGLKTGNNPNGAGEVYLRTQVTDTAVWVGQQVSLGYKLFSTIPIDRYNVVEEPGYEDFYAQDMRRFDSRQQREIINGAQYASRVIKQVALFPQRAGDLKVGQFNIQLITEETDPRSRNSFFPLTRTRLIPAVVAPLTIHARSLPPDPPAGFTGAVGSFEAGSAMGNNRITTDDALSVKLTITGNGDPKRLQPPDIAFPEGFEAYPPRTSDESTFEQDNQVVTQKTFEYLAVPEKPGTYTFNVHFSWFDPDSVKYVTYTSNDFQVTVAQGSNRKKRPVDTAETDETADQDIRYLKTDIRLTEPRLFTGSVAFWALGSFPMVAFLGLFFFRQWQVRKSSADPVQTNFRKARKLALQTLAAADTHRQTGNGRAYYEALESALNGYLERKLNLPASNFQSEVIRGKLTEKGVSEKLTDEFFSLRHRVEMALYAGAIRQEDMERDHQRAAEWIAAVEEMLVS